MKTYLKLNQLINKFSDTFNYQEKLEAYIYATNLKNSFVLNENELTILLQIPGYNKNDIKLEYLNQESFIYQKYNKFLIKFVEKNIKGLEYKEKIEDLYIHIDFDIDNINAEIQDGILILKTNKIENKINQKEININ